MKHVKYSANVGLRRKNEEVLRARLTVDGLPAATTLFGKAGLADPLRKAVNSQLAPKILEAIHAFHGSQDIQVLRSVLVELDFPCQPNDEATHLEDYLCSHWEPVEPLGSFDRLILPQSTLQILDDAATAVTAAKQVFDEWDFRSNYNGRRPACVLNFYGPPGTGKTASAHALAAKLGVPILVAQYSQIESKFVGDSAKNLDSVFVAAEQRGALLLFDEADVLLSKRVASQSSSDHALNALRTSMLLWLERFSGICVLATNNRESYDSAFDRRILFDICFSLPTPDEVERILAAHLPANAPIHEAATLSAISTLLDGFSGADIRDTVLRAALAASRDGGLAIEISHFEKAATVIRASRRSRQATDWVKERIDTAITASKEPQ